MWLSWIAINFISRIFACYACELMIRGRHVCQESIIFWQKWRYIMVSLYLCIFRANGDSGHLDIITLKNSRFIHYTLMNCNSCIHEKNELQSIWWSFSPLHEWVTSLNIVAIVGIYLLRWPMYSCYLPSILTKYLLTYLQGYW